jgi:hypothetical protein
MPKPAPMGSLVITIKTEIQDKFLTVAMLLFQMQQNNCIKVALFFPQRCQQTPLQGPHMGLVSFPPHNSNVTVNRRKTELWWPTFIPNSVKMDQTAQTLK